MAVKTACWGALEASNIPVILFFSRYDGSFIILPTVHILISFAYVTFMRCITINKMFQKTGWCQFVNTFN